MLAALLATSALGFGAPGPALSRLAAAHPAARRAAPSMTAAGHALILQNKGGGHGEIGYHLAKALQAKGLEVTLVQDPAAKPNKPPFNLYDTELVDCNVAWCEPTDTAAVAAALEGGPALTHVFDNYAKDPAGCAAAMAAAKGAGDAFKLYAFVSSAGMYTAKGELSEDGPIKEPPTGQREVEIAISQAFAGKWCAFRPQYIYGPHTNKRDYLDWFLGRAARGLPLPIPGDGSQRVSVTHCADVAALLASVVGQEGKAGGEVFNCGAPADVTYAQLCDAAAAACGKPAADVRHLPAGTKTSFPFRPNAEGFYVSPAKAMAALGWSPAHSVLEDLKPGTGFYAKDYFDLGLDKGGLDTLKDGL